MENKLPAVVHERIKADAANKYPHGGLYYSSEDHTRSVNRRIGYIAGATAWAGKIQALIDALTAIGNGCATPQYRANSALQQWKEGKEVGK